MRRVKTKVTLEQAKERLIAYRDAHEDRYALYGAAQLADVIWPDAEWVRSQGAGAAASRVLKKVGAYWCAKGQYHWGWRLSSL